MKATYLIRFDDICPAMNWQVWEQVEQILDDAGVKPLLAVVPDNRDPELNVATEDPAFWNKVRDWQNRGWSIGLHGFQHTYVSKSAGILGRNRYSEFAGLPEPVQFAKLSGALNIFRQQGVRADAWIAPAHSFDETTVALLARLGVDCISDGYSLFPYVSGDGMFWVPQQLGRFYRMPFGNWTVCLHINKWNQQDVEKFRQAIATFAGSITSLDEIGHSYRHRRQRLSDQLFFTCFRTLRSLRA